MRIIAVPIRFPMNSGPSRRSPTPVPVLTVTERARRYIARCPAAISGQGGHDTTFRVASVLWNGFGLSEDDSLALLREYNQRCVPPWSEAELVHKVRSAANARHDRARGYLVGRAEDRGQRAESRNHLSLPSPPAERVAKPVFCPMVLKRVAAQAAAVRDVVGLLAERSPVPLEGITCGGFLRRLYPKGSGEKVLVFSTMQSQGQLLWKADAGDLVLEDQFPAGPDGVWFLAQPVDGEFHNNPRLGGKPSRRSEESVTAPAQGADTNRAGPIPGGRASVLMTPDKG